MPRLCAKTDILSTPILFTLFINDLIEYLRQECTNGVFVSNDIEDILALLFSDDVTCVSDTIFHLQKQLNVIHKYCLSVGMKLNLDTTKIIVFRNGGVLKNKKNKWYYDGNEVETVSYYKYLASMSMSRLC